MGHNLGGEHMGDLMGELRGALHDPSASSWQNITTLLDEWKDRAQLVEEAIPYAYGLLSRWPEDIPRPIPRSWAKGFFREGPVSPELFDLLTLVDDISPVRRYSSRHNEVVSSVTPPDHGSPLPLLARTFWLRYPASQAHLVWLFASDAPRLRSFALEYRELDTSLAKKLRQATWFGEGLEHLRLIISDEAMFELLADVKLPNIKTVDLSDARGLFGEMGILALLEALDGAAIDRFDFCRYSLTEEVLEVLGEHRTLNQIKELDLRRNIHHIHETLVDEFLESPKLRPDTKQSMQGYYDDIFE